MAIVGYIVVAIAKTRRTRERKYEALSYGTEQEPAPEELLLRGCATIFKTEGEALVALRAAEATTTRWNGKHELEIIEVYGAPE